jgi:hypothetical protein
VTKQENPGRSQDFQEPKTKIYETFCRRSGASAGLMIRTAAKITLFSIMQVFFQKNPLFYVFLPAAKFNH